MEIDAVRTRAEAFQLELEDVKQSIAPTEWRWYPYGSLSNFVHLDNLLTGPRRGLFTPSPGRRLLDIGAADGDTSFFLERLGFEVDVIDYAPTNANGCRGLEALKSRLDSAVSITQADLDSQFELPAQRYDLALVLGLLYHLKNPYYLLERLATRVERVLLSTRIARFNRSEEVPTGRLNAARVDLADVPVAYLVDPLETNNDPTNFWIFTQPALRRLLSRTGWEVEDFMTVGAVDRSDPASAEGDERAFCLVRSTLLPAAV